MPETLHASDIHPDSLIEAIEEVASRHPFAVTAEGRGRVNLPARVLVELGWTWPEVDELSDRMETMDFAGHAGEYWRLLNELSYLGWTWEAIASIISSINRNRNTPLPPF